MAHDPRQLARVLVESIHDTAPAEATEKIRRFVASLKARGIGTLAPAVLAALPAALDEVMGIADVRLHASRPLSDEEVRMILARHGIAPEKSRVLQEVRPETVGGYRLHTKGKIIDGSVGGTLQQLGAKLGG